MDAVEFLRKRSRMCEMYGDCERCAMEGRDCLSCEAVEIVEKWSKENSVHTYYDEFKKRFPKHKYLSFSYLAGNFCVTSLFGVNCDCYKNCEECWEQEYKEN